MLSALQIIARKTRVMNESFFLYSSKFKLGLFLDGSMISHDSFHHHPSSNSFTTLKISLIVNIENSQQLELKLHSKKLLEAAILPGSSFSIVMLGKSRFSCILFHHFCVPTYSFFPTQPLMLIGKYAYYVRKDSFMCKPNR